MHDSARTLFAGILGDTDMTALLLDPEGGHLAGSYLNDSGREIGGEIGAALSGIKVEVTRATRHLEVGDWRALVIETADATIALSPVAGESVVLLAASSEEPHGLIRRVLSRSAARAAQWLREERRQ